MIQTPILALLGLSLLAATALRAEDQRPLFLPFEVKMGEQTAAMKTGNELFAVVEKAVPADVAVTIEEASPLLVINAFPCREDGTVLEGQPAGIIFARNAREVKLNATMDKKPLAPGTYLMNVVAHNKTSRVVFTVADKDGQAKLPDLKKIFEFLKNK